jgi:ketosteroid isomerase-like protein
VEEIWENLRVEPGELIDAGDDVVAVVRMSGKRRISGMKEEVRVSTIWTFHEGKVLRYTSYRNRATALEAVGLSE